MLPFLLILSVFVDQRAGYKVLVFNPAFGASHSNFFGKLSDILIDAGHDVTMLIPVHVDWKKHLIGSKKVKKVIRIPQDPRVYQMHVENSIEQIMKRKIWKMDSNIISMLSYVENVTKTVGYQTEYLFQHTEIIEKLRQEKFDLGIAESLFISAFALFDEIAIRTVINAESCLYQHAVKEALGEPAALSHYPGHFSPVDDKMNFVGKLKNLMGFVIGNWFSCVKYKSEVAALPASYQGSRDWKQHLSRVAFNFVNSNQFIDYASPSLPKTVFVGGMQVNTSKDGKAELSGEWDELLSRRRTNILVSFGTMAFSSDMPDEFKNSWLEVFASMPNATFIWKYEQENSTIADHLPNVKLTSWMPQNELLADERLSLFITHGGLGSTIELAYHGKPAIMIPLMADQPRNTHMLARHGGAFQLAKTNLNRPNEILKAIEIVLGDESYQKNAQKLASILDEQPFKPKDVVLRHCDFAVKFGALEKVKPGYKLFEALKKKYGPVHTFWMAKLPVVHVSDWNLIKQHFIKDGASYTGRPVFPLSVEIRKGSYGVIESFGPRWQQQRRFALHVLRDFGLGKNLMEEKILGEVSTMFERIESHPDQVDMQNIFDACVGSIINTFLFGYRYDESNMNEFLELKERLSKHFKLGAEPVGFLLGIYPWIGNFPVFSKFKHIVIDNWQSLMSMFARQVKQKLATIDYDSDEYSDYVEAFLKERKKHENEPNYGGYEMEQLDSACFDMWVAGMETTSNTLYWSLLYVLLNPEVRGRVYEELDRVIGSHRIITTSDRNQLNYINATINETQRLANLLPLNVMRATSADVEIAGHRILRNTIIVPQISTVMYDPEIFPDPHTFKPERFLEKNGSLKKVEEFVPFSIGKRQCLGEGLARMELFLFFANLFNKFDISLHPSNPSPSTEKDYGVTMRAKNYRVVMKKR
ncbi:unnamed protein product [Caenorhabditis sp. 36 PRJEB53466]|nr:unnamed protein product [Caenorhabditis sp. 36 PRJEB53466]